MSEIKEHLKELDDKFEELENIIARIDEQNHFNNRADVFIDVSEIGVSIDKAKKTVYKNLGE